MLSRGSALARDAELWVRRVTPAPGTQVPPAGRLRLPLWPTALVLALGVACWAEFRAGLVLLAVQLAGVALGARQAGGWDLTRDPGGRGKQRAGHAA